MMGLITRIVVATDISDFASRAESRAALLAQELSSESLDLIHVIDSLALESLRNLTLPLDTEQQLMQGSREQMAEIKRRLTARYGIKVTTTTVNVGRADTEIAHYASLLKAGLVVLGAFGGGAVREFLIGSTADKVLRTLSCPLLIVKQEPEASYRRVLVPVDFSESSHRAVEMALTIAPHANIIILHAFEVPFEGRLDFSDERIHTFRTEVKTRISAKMQKLLSDFDASGRSLAAVIEPGPAADTVIKKAEEIHADLIVVGKHGKSGWESMLLGSVARRVIQETVCDVLVVEQADTAAG